MSYNPVCPTCKGAMWMDYESSQWGKDYFWKCSKKKKYNPNCPDRNKYLECDKCSKCLFECTCKKEIK